MVGPKMIVVEVAVVVATVSTMVTQQADATPTGWAGTIDTLLGSATVALLLVVMLQLSGVRERLKHTPTKEEMGKADTHWRHQVHNNLIETVGKMEMDLAHDIQRIEVDIKEGVRRVEEDLRDVRRRLDGNKNAH